MAYTKYVKEIKQTTPKMQQLVTNLRRYGMSRSEINEAVREAMDKAEKSM